MGIRCAADNSEYAWQELTLPNCLVTAASAVSALPVIRTQARLHLAS